MLHQHTSKILATQVDPVLQLVLKMHILYHQLVQNQLVLRACSISIYNDVISKRYIILQLRAGVDKYLIIVLMFLIAGMGIAITRTPASLGLFYSMLAGAIVVIIYSSIKSRKQNPSKPKKLKK